MLKRRICDQCSTPISKIRRPVAIEEKVSCLTPRDFGQLESLAQKMAMNLLEKGGEGFEAMEWSD